MDINFYSTKMLSKSQKRITTIMTIYSHMASDGVRLKWTIEDCRLTLGLLRHTRYIDGKVKPTKVGRVLHSSLLVYSIFKPTCMLCTFIKHVWICSLYLILIGQLGRYKSLWTKCCHNYGKDNKKSVEEPFKICR